jgi:hypothetical protein
MDDEHATGNGVGGGGIGRRSRSERLEFARVAIAWSTAIDQLGVVASKWRVVVDDLLKVGTTLDGPDRSRKIIELMKMIEHMRETEERSVETRTYLGAIKTQLEGLP